MTNLYRPQLGSIVKTPAGKSLGLVTNVYKEGNKVWVVVDDDFELPQGDLVEIIDLTNGDNYYRVSTND